MNDVVVPEKVVYPILAASAWWKLRRKAKQSPPRVIDNDYIATVLDISEKAAKNVGPQLRRFGLVGDDGTTTSLLLDWRDDDKYPEACQAILERVYPERMREMVGTDKPEAEQVVKYLARAAKAGEPTAKQMAAVYMLLCARDPSGGDEIRTRSTSAGGERAPKSVAPRKSKAAAEPVSVQAPIPVPVSAPTVSVPSGPTLHVDVQIHISPDASAEQIDTIFASMARHFSNRPS